MIVLLLVGLEAASVSAKQDPVQCKLLPEYFEFENNNDHRKLRGKGGYISQPRSRNGGGTAHSSTSVPPVTVPSTS
jgi:hypothetical protein